MRGFVVRTCLLIDLWVAIPIFTLLILIDPERYVKTLEASGPTIRALILKYRSGA